AEGFDAGLQSVGQAIAHNLPATSAVGAARDARAGKMRRAPCAWSVVGSGHKNHLWIRWTKHESIRVAADFVFPPRPLLPTGAGVRADVQSPPGHCIQESRVARMNHEPVDVLV